MPARRFAQLSFATLWLVLGMAATGSSDDPPQARRIVSMNPSLTSILVALDAAHALVGVEEHAARLHTELASVPVVGGLFNPSLEAVIALEPDLVILVPSAEQRDFRGRLESLGIDVLPLPNISVAEILVSIDKLGARVGRAAQARARIDEIQASFAAVRADAAERPLVRTIVVLQRDPLFVVGSGSFIDEILRAAGGSNVAGVFDEPYPQVDVEWLIDAAPEVILDATEAPPDAATYWNRWPSIPAVAAGRVVVLPLTETFPGPYIDRSLHTIAASIHRTLPQNPRAAAP